MPKHTVRTVQKIVAVLLLLLQFPVALPAAATTVENVRVTAASLETNSAAINGMVRVYLSSLGNPSTLNLTVTGNYSVNGDTSQSVASGSALTVTFSSSTGAITLNRNGSVTNMGMYFALRRHSTSGSNGVKIRQARESANPYPGDLSFRAVKQSGGGYKLYTVAHIYIENYLYGVLPYEMGNSSSVEALKAQAVAARTYTVRMMQSRASGYYDVVDTTSDQVYRGTPSGNANCVAAVDATKGVVLKYGSAYPITYYSASNGGQTESAANALGKSGYDYLVVKDDPFDLANTSSTVKSKTVSADLTSAYNPAALVSLLKTKAVSALAAAGYAASAANTSLQTLKSVTPHTPKYASPSKLYTKLDFAMTASTVAASGAAVTASVTVTCDIFGELESPLSMSIQSTKNELWSVKKTSSGFTLQARRYGHGLGMSQRGAMYMGRLGYTYDEILGFYYVGCKRVRQSFTNTILSAVSGSEETTVEDAAELTDAAAGTCKGTIKLVSTGSSLAIRAGKSTSAALIGTAGNGAMVTVLSSDGTWCYIQYGSLRGYVPLNALSLSGTPSGTEGEVTSVQGFVTVTANDYVNLRASASMSAGILGTAPSGAVLTVLSLTDGWAQVQYCALTAYASRSFLSAVAASYPSAVASTGSVSATITTEDGTGTVNLRATASTSGAVLAQLPHGAQVTVTGDDGAWATVNCNGQTGYVMSSFLTTSGESPVSGGGTEANPGDGAGGEAGTGTEAQPGDDTENAGETGTEGGTDGAAGTEGVTKAVVTTSYGSLNMRAEAKAGSPIVTTIPKGAEIDVLAVGEPWCGVRYLSMYGYVMSSFLTLRQSAMVTPGPAVGGDTATVNTLSGSLNLRERPSASASVLMRIPQYAVVSVAQRGAEWCAVSYNGVSGYVMTGYLLLSATVAPTLTPTPTPTPTPAPTATAGDAGGEAATPSVAPSETSAVDGSTAVPTPSPTPSLPPTPAPQSGPKTATVVTPSGSLNLRAMPQSGARILTGIPPYAMVTVITEGDTWCQVTYGSYAGYVMTRFLSIPSAGQGGGTAAENNGDAAGGSAASGNPTAESAEGTAAWVLTASGSLNLRAAASASSQVLLAIPRYAQVTVLGAVGQWSQVRYNGVTGYAMSVYLTGQDPMGRTAATTVSPSPSPAPAATDGASAPPTAGEATATPSPAPTATPSSVPPSDPLPVLDASLRPADQGTYAIINPREDQALLSLWPQCVESGQSLMDLERGTEVLVIQTGDTWYQVQAGSVAGYCLARFLALPGQP